MLPQFALQTAYLYSVVCMPSNRSKFNALGIEVLLPDQVAERRQPFRRGELARAGRRTAALSAGGVPEIEAQHVELHGLRVVIADALHDELGWGDRLTACVARLAVRGAAEDF